ncbi:hypothetical protein YC2023_030999 [Brassica napus]
MKLSWSDEIIKIISTEYIELTQEKQNENSRLVREYEKWQNFKVKLDAKLKSLEAAVHRSIPVKNDVGNNLHGKHESIDKPLHPVLLLPDLSHFFCINLF